MQGAFKGIISEGEYREPFLDWMSHNQVIQDSLHNSIHNGITYEYIYSVPSLGAMTTPDDMITLTWTTADSTERSHFFFACSGTAGWRVRFIEGGTGGGANATGTFTPPNKFRESTNVCNWLNGLIYYDATLVTGGTTLVDEYMAGSSLGNASAAVQTGGRDEWVLKPNTQYQVSLYGTDTNAATILLNWYEYTAYA
jgi:hypothetical protein